jgi:cobalt-zinc-cadmium efflux system outer membrane protein
MAYRLVMLLMAAIFALAQSSGPTARRGLDERTLDQAVAEAMENNIGLLAERFNVAIADARMITARLRPNPVLSIGGDHLDLLGTGYNSVNNAGPAEYSLRTDFLLERGGKRASRIETAENAKEVAELQLLDAVRSLRNDVQTAGVEVLLAKSNLALAEENLQALREIVRVNQLRLKSGDLAEVELLRVQLAELQFENSVRQAQLRLDAARTRLSVLLGRGRNAKLVDVKDELRRDAGPVILEELFTEAKSLRPDLLALQREQARSLAEVRLQIAQGKVDYTVGTEYRRQQGLAGTGNSLGVFFSTNLPVFNRNQGEIARATQEQKQIEARLRQAQLTVENDVELAFLQYANAKALLERVESTMLAKARDVRQITEFSYRRGEATLIEFLDAQRAYNDTIQTYNEARAEFAKSLYAIDAATGRGTK